MYCGRTVGFKSCVCTVHIQVCTSGNKKLQGPESKPAKQLIPFNLVEICQKYSQFCYEILYCIQPMNIREKFQFCPVVPCSNDRVVFASMLHVFIASVNKRNSIDKRSHFVLKQYCIFLTELPTPKRDMEWFARVSILFP